MASMRSTEHALTAGKTWYLLFCFLTVAIRLRIDFAQYCRVLYGFNAGLRCNGRFSDGFTCATSACL